MAGFLISLAGKKGGNIRERYAVLSGGAGIVCNLILCIIKFIIGSISGSVAILADGVNNLSDGAGNAVTIIGAKLSNKPVDKEHPFGHGRVEYISAFAVAFSILIMSFELAKSGIERLIEPRQPGYSIWFIISLAVAILIKLWMAYFNYRLYKLTDNLNLKAIMKDSFNDCIATAATIITLILSDKFHIYWLDGAVGIAVAIFVFLSGINMLREIVGPLIGQPPSKEIVENIERIILSNNQVMGIHDLIIHNYGAGKYIASAHAEVPAHIDLITIHGIIDSAEREIEKQLGIEICIHIDPVETADGRLHKYDAVINEVIKNYNKCFSYHDLHFVDDNGEEKLLFDLIIPYEENERREIIFSEISEILKERLPKIKADFKIENPFIS